ncbi:MAG: diphosphomevalonate decarboxylase [Candidatus Marsarchaeota archaeon]|nr:diphosphomevalonate decarboxylase [Candidatus Marsarchaeota archaeon]
MLVRSVAPTNIAVIKYWGKNPHWEKWHIPTKSSLSWTVQDLTTTTELEVRKGSGKADFTLNGKTITPQMGEYEYVRDMLLKLFEYLPQTKKYDYRIVSRNNFPTAAGFASSAAGFAALAKALAGAMEKLEPKMFKQHMGDDKLLSALARLGSGSAARSIPSSGGFVVWRRGISYPKCPKPEGMGEAAVQKALRSSFSETLFAPSHWPQMRVLYAKVETGEKKIKSRAGMKTSILTCPLYDRWVEVEEGRSLGEMVDAVSARDFGKFGALAMQASDALHAVMLATSPSITYLNDTSVRIKHEIMDMNAGGGAGSMKAAYTFDAGPNAVVFCLEKDEAAVKRMLEGIVGAQNVTATRPGPGARIEKIEE